MGVGGGGGGGPILGSGIFVPMCCGALSNRRVLFDFSFSNTFFPAVARRTIVSIQ